MSDDLVSVYQAGDLPLAELIRQRLEDEGIEAFIDPTASPLDGLTTINQGTHIFVRQPDAQRAQNVVEEFLAEHEA